MKELESQTCTSRTWTQDSDESSPNYSPRSRGEISAGVNAVRGEINAIIGYLVEIGLSDDQDFSIRPRPCRRQVGSHIP